MKKALLLLIGLTIVSACSKDDTVNPEPEPMQVPKYTVTIKAGDGGTVSIAGGTYNKDSEVSVTATPNAEYLFQAWSDGNTDNPRTIKVGADLSIAAIFIKKRYDLTVTVVGEGAVSEEVVIQGGRYNSGSQIKLTATAAEGWGFNSWSGVIESTDNPITVIIDDSKEVTATFNKLPSAYLDANGVTIKANSWAEVGDTWESQGKIYLIVDRAMLSEMVRNGEDLSVAVTSKILDFSGLFKQLENPPVDIGHFDTSNAITMEDMFYATGTFNADISSWDVSKVQVFDWMFYQANEFNWDISNWDVSSATSMNDMFRGARSFNQPIEKWDVSNVTSMVAMFNDAEKFDQPLDGWDVSSVTNMGGLFRSSGFNHPIGNWDVSSVENMSYMLFSTKFNRPINDWNVENVINMERMFSQNSEFNQQLSNWDVGNVKSMQSMFHGCTSFNQDISNWLTNNVTTMLGMFMDAHEFNQDISSWDVSNVNKMLFMFIRAKEFNQDLSQWNVSKVDDCIQFSIDASSWILPKPNFTNCSP